MSSDDEKLGFCPDCPDHEACASGFSCGTVKQVDRDARARKTAERERSTPLADILAAKKAMEKRRPRYAVRGGGYITGEWRLGCLGGLMSGEEFVSPARSISVSSGWGTPVTRVSTDC